MWHLIPMLGLRSLFALFLALALLPWGAFANQMPSGRSAPHSAFVQDWAGEHEFTASAQTEAKLVAPKHCRGPVLPGSACNPVLGLLPEAADTPWADGVAHPRATADLAATGRDLSPPLGPPRSY